MKILVVDDSFYARQLIVRALTKAGHTITEASGGIEAIDIFKKEVFDAATVDMIMPDMDGIELIKKLHALNRDIPLIAVTADIQDETKKDALEAGAIAFVSKTAKPDVILNILNSLKEESDFLFLSMDEKDAFTELINISMGQAAGALSSLLGRRIILKVPHFEIVKASRLKGFFEEKLEHVGAAIHQRFSGTINGLASLVLPYEHAVLFVRILLSVEKDINRLTPSEQTVLAEVGNIVLNSAISTLGNRLNIRLAISIPDVHLIKPGGDIADIITSYTCDSEHAIIILSHLTISEVELISYIVLILPRVAIIKLLRELRAQI